MKAEDDDRGASLVVDIDDLGDEVLRHAEFFRVAAEHLEEVRAVVAERKAAMELLDATLSIAVRKDPAKYGVAKVTDSIVSAMVTVDPTFQKAQSRYLSAKKSQGIAQVQVDALEHKKRMIEKAVDLFLADFFADPSGGRAKKLSEEAGQSARRKLSKRTNG